MTTTQTYHVTRTDGASTYGHCSTLCNESGCAGTERYLGAYSGENGAQRHDLLTVDHMAGVVSIERDE